MTLPEITVLGIDTSGKYASCAVYRGPKLLAETSFFTKLTHSQVILPTVERTLSDASLTLSDIELFAAAAGPGSYTGLRIGIAAVKGLCALGKPCIGISTLEAMAYNTFREGLMLPSIYARPGVSYFGAYLCDGEKITPFSPDKVGAESEIKALADGYPGEVILVGESAEKIKAELFYDDKNVKIAPPNQSAMNAGGVCLAALNRYKEAGTADSLRAKYLQNTMAEKLKDREVKG